MSLSDRRVAGSRWLAGFVLLASAAALSACTVEPLARAQPDSAIAAGTASESVAQILAATEVTEVSTRTAQQVRNRLLFAMNGGRQRDGGRYRVTLSVSESTSLLSVRANNLAPTSAQVQVIASYTLVDKESGKTVASGRRQALAAYDRTPQSFANMRAQRDAQNRAAREVAELVRLAVAQDVAAL